MDDTIFCIVTTAFFLILIPPFLNFTTTAFTAFTASSDDLEPVQTILPVLNSNVDVLGVLRRKTAPGNWSGLYSTAGNFF